MFNSWDSDYSNESLFLCRVWNWKYEDLFFSFFSDWQPSWCVNFAFCTAVKLRDAVFCAVVSSLIGRSLRIFVTFFGAFLGWVRSRFKTFWYGNCWKTAPDGRRSGLGEKDRARDLLRPPLYIFWSKEMHQNPEGFGVRPPQPPMGALMLKWHLLIY